MKRIVALFMTACIAFSMLAGCSDPIPPAEKVGLNGAFLISHLEGMKVGYMEGFSDPDVIKEGSRGAKLKKYTSLEKLAQDVKDGKLYAAVLPQVYADDVLSENRDLAQMLQKLEEGAYSFTNCYKGPEEDYDILMQADATLSLIKGNGDYQVLLDRYIYGNPDDVEEIELNSATTGRTLTVGIYPNFKPFAYKSKSGNLVGFAVEFANAVAKTWDSNIEFFVYDDADELYQDSKDDKVMIAIGPFTKTDDVPEDFYYSKPYIDMSQVVILRDDNVGKIPQN
ncbi:MAG: transporter substrate-binding domain-containing protein [Ruminococcaceae bacterium]|nr:transporter substrate-binding domain-containing protein [Oscillospiraceae bacterium]